MCSVPWNRLLTSSTSLLESFGRTVHVCYFCELMFVFGMVHQLNSNITVMDTTREWPSWRGPWMLVFLSFAQSNLMICKTLVKNLSDYAFAKMGLVVLSWQVAEMSIWTCFPFAMWFGSFYVSASLALLCRECFNLECSIAKGCVSTACNVVLMPLDC